MRLLIAFAIAAAIPVSISSQQPRLPDPGGLGSFAIGHTWLVVTDTRPDPSDDTVRGTRPISVNVWYPVDATDVIGRTPDGLYPFDRNTTPPSFLPTISADWESPCDNLVPPPPSDLLCEPAATHHPPTYEGVLPSALGPFPLVVFSTGWGNRALAYAYFAQRLASHSFVIAVSEHPRDRTTTRPPLPSIPRDAYYVAMYNRPRDVSFILDTLLAMNDEPGGLLHNSMKPDQVAAAGHSIGGYTSLTMAGGDNEVCLNEDSVQPLPTPCVPITDQLGNAVAMLPDPRIKAIVTLDAVNRSLRFGELARITIPSMSIGESYDAPGWPTFLGARQHAAIPGEFNYRVDIPGAVHQSFESSCTGIWVAYRYGLSNGQITAQSTVVRDGAPAARSESAVGEVRHSVSEDAPSGRAGLPANSHPWMGADTRIQRRILRGGAE